MARPSPSTRQRTLGGRRCARQSSAGRLRDQPTPVVVRQDGVVVLGQETGRSRRVGIGQRGVGQIVQLAPTFVAERAEFRPQSLGHLADAREAAPGGDVGVARRTERRQVAQHDVIDRRLGRGRSTEPRLGGGRPHLAALSPQASGRCLHERQVVAAGIGQGGTVASRGTAPPAPAATRSR